MLFIGFQFYHEVEELGTLCGNIVLELTFINQGKVQSGSVINEQVIIDQVA